jgi:group I intron endonuclease
MKGVIYCYYCIPTGRKYIGQTRNERKRKNSHFYCSKYTTDNNKFYNAIRKYGWENFIYGIIGEFNLLDLDDMETYYIQEYNTVNEGYNTLSVGVSCNRSYFAWNKGKRNVYTLSEETKKLMSENRQNRKWWNNGIEETWVENPPNSNWLPGRLPSHFEKSKQGAIKSSVKYLLEIISPTGEKFITNNVRQFCRENNLCRVGFYRVIKGTNDDYRGWTVHILEHLR